MNDSKQRRIGAVLSYVSIIINTLIQFLYTPFLVRMLGQSEFGLYSLVISIIGYLTVLDLGFGNAIVVYTAKYRAQNKYEEEKKLHGMFFIIFCIIGFISGLIGFILFLNIDNLFGKTMTSIELYKTKIMMLILTFNLIITFVFSIYTSILNAYEKFVYRKVITILNTLLKPLIMIPLLFLGYKSITMVVVVTILNIGVLLSNYFYCRKKLNIKIRYRGFDKKIFIVIFSYSIWLFLASVVDKVNWSVDQFILGAVSGTIAVSIYSVAGTLNQLFINLSTAISGVFLPKMTKMVAKQATSKQLTKEMIKVGRIQFYIMFLVTTGYIIFGKQFIIWWVGKKFVTTYYVGLCLICPAFFSLIQNLGLSIMQAMNKYKFKAITTFIMAIFNVIISYFLAKKYGPVGAALGTTLSLVLCNIFLINIYYYKVINLNIIEFWKTIFKMIVPLLIPIIVIILLIVLKPVNSMLIYVCYILLYMIMYSVISFFFVMNDYEREIIDKFHKLLFRRKNNVSTKA